MLSNAYFLAKFRFDTAENEPAKNLQNFRKMYFRKMHFRKMHFRKMHFRKVWEEALPHRAHGSLIRRASGAEEQAPRRLSHIGAQGGVDCVDLFDIPKHHEEDDHNVEDFYKDPEDSLMARIATSETFQKYLIKTKPMLQV